MTGTAIWGRRLALAAIVVQVPRLVLMALAADHLRLPAAWEGLFVGISGVGAALALTGGNVYLAHVVALTRRWLLAVPWLLVLACTAVLLTPMQVAGLERRHLESVLSTPELRWFFVGTSPTWGSRSGPLPSRSMTLRSAGRRSGCSP